MSDDDLAALAVLEHPHDAGGLYQALLAVQAEVPALPLDAKNPHFNSRFTSLAKLTELVMPILTKHGLVWVALPAIGQDGKPSLRYRMTHATTGQMIEGDMPLMLVKSDPQSQGSAITYARRYSLSAVLNLVADEDDDGNAGTRQAARPPAQAAKTQAVANDTQVEALKAAAGGLKAAQVRLAFQSVGLTPPGAAAAPGMFFDCVPALDVAKLIGVLKTCERAG